MSLARQRKRAVLLQRAVELHAGGNASGSEAICRKMIRDDPCDVDALHLCGLACQARSEHAQGEAFIRRALKLNPGFAAAWSNLGNVVLAAGRASDARLAYEQALQADPGFAPAHHNLAKLLARDSPADALEHAREACRLQPGEVSSWLLHAEIAAMSGDGEGAEAALRRAVALAPSAAEPRTNLGNLLAGLGRHEDALAEHHRAVHAQPSSAAAWYGLATAQRTTGLVAEALGSADNALQRDPASADAWNLKGACLRALGRFDEAVSCFEEAVARRPHFAQAMRNIAISRHGRADDREVERLRDLLDGGPAEEAAVSAGFALGKLLDDMQRYDEAFTAFSGANALAACSLARAGRAYDPAAFETSARAALEPSQGQKPFSSELPVLVVGMPRSGTTLVEQILASHPQVSGAGELPELSRLLAAGDAVGQRYVGSLARRWPGAARVVDKMPDNILLLCKAAPILPQARVILCRRDARDTALSCFMTRFSAGNAFAYDFWACGHRCGATEWLTDRLEEQLPVPHLTIHYEALVRNLEVEARRMIAFLGLDWNPCCLDFHRTERAVLTASAWQVRQPIFTGSVGRWRRYEKHMTPMLEGWSAAGSKFVTRDAADPF